MAQATLSYFILLIAAPMVFSDIADLENECQKETGFKGTHLDINLKEPSSVSKEAKCFLACMMEKQKIMKADGSFDKEESVSVLEQITNGDEAKKQKLIKIRDECLTEVKFTEDKCNSAFEFMKCKIEKLGH